MKIIKYTGGLGNQMFQYAFSLVLKARGETVLADLDLYKAHKFRRGIDMNHGDFELERVFNIALEKADKKLVCKYGTLADTLIHRVRRKFFTKKTHIIEYSSEYNSDLLCDKRDLYVEGYFQNPKYFLGCEKEIMSAFNFSLPLNEKSASLLTKINQLHKNKKVTASIHVRRGDYINSTELYLCGKKYFENAIQILYNAVGNIDAFIIFSDDIAWCKENILIGNTIKGANKTSQIIFVDWNKEKDSWQDMFLMTKCIHNIIPNSSFSFWGAYLNQNNGKVVAPKIWNKNGFSEVNVESWLLAPVGI